MYKHQTSEIHKHYFDNLVSNIKVQASVYFTGDICGTHDFEQDDRESHIHLIKDGNVRVTNNLGKEIPIEEPSLVFLPRPFAHQLIVNDHSNATVICGTIKLGIGGKNPITTSLPDLIIVKLTELNGIEKYIDLIFLESILNKNGNQAVQNRLCEILIIKVLSYCSQYPLTSKGVFSGLNEPRIAKALHAIHSDPAEPWTVERLAYESNLSRAHFSNLFHQIVGNTPLEYLTIWRLLMAQKFLCQGVTLERIASEVGYSSASALTRAFSKHLGISPTQWLKLTAENSL
ncbi:AraC family transcriptional regulator [Acinetobacter portensis]|uniref:AraC family transcriptional regulator n=1 Tax=Acinetobacter portensis TaxID=1839785 RepID=A0ABY4JZH3_9GAMM|nr:AraC family transcriptional regulator [Acinetobacter portensis]MCK7609862.1 AraC family transcriptional regulator [Acinetobacter portensis]MCK7640637.1 AraC family transcriptional regulator [Acinetobacter portensis]UPO24818.1 AraC family transcriptional regulator [Acinetobacter portensis]